MSSCCRPRPLPSANVNRQAQVHAVHPISDSGASWWATNQGVAADAARIATARVVEPRCQAL